MKKQCIRIIGDLHGKTAEYLDLIKDVEYSVQIGDFSFDYSDITHLNSEKHVII